MEEDLVTEVVGVPSREGPEWKHVIVVETKAKQQPKVQCLYCDKVFTGGATRIRAHILGDRPAVGVAKCAQVQDLARDAYVAMKKLQADKDAAVEEKAKRRKLYDLSQSMASASNFASGSGSQSTIPGRFKIMSADGVDQAWAQAFYANGVPFALADDAVFIDAVKKTAGQSSAYKPPSAWRLSNGLLDSAMEAMTSDLQVP